MMLDMPYTLTLRDGTTRDLYGPWRVDAAAELVASLARAGRWLLVARGGYPCTDPYSQQIDPGAVVRVSDPRGVVVSVRA
jgi:hypothetical protein